MSIENLQRLSKPNLKLYTRIEMKVHIEAQIVFFLRGNREKHS